MKKRKFGLILLISVLMIAGLKLAYAFTFVDDSDTDFSSGDFSINSTIKGTGVSANVTINISLAANQTENLFGRGIEINASVILYMRFEEGTGQYANDSSQYGNNGTLGANNAAASDDPSWNSSTKFENFGLSFDGSNDEVDIPDSSSLSMGGNVSFTVTAWIKLLEKGVNNAQIVGKFNTGNQEYQMEWTGSASDRVRFRCNCPSDASIDADSFGSIPLNEWIFIVGWFDVNANTVNIQVNGGPIDTLTDITEGPPDGPSLVRIGGGGGSVAWINIVIDEVSIWNITLNDATREDLYQKGWGYFNQSNFTSQTFDATHIANWTTISWQQEVPYDKEIGRASGDGVDATDEDTFINTTGLVLLMHFNNETGESERKIEDIYDISQEKELVLYMTFDSANAKEITPNGSIVLLMHFNNDTGTGENASLFFNNATNSTGRFLNNGTCNLDLNTCPVYNISNTRLGKAALTFDGFDDNITVSSPFAPTGSADRTISLWVYSTRNPSHSGSEYIYQYGSAADLQLFGFGIDNAEQWAFVGFGGGNSFFPSGVALNQWSHTAVTYDGTDVKMYIDGAFVGGFTKALNTGDTEFIIGGPGKAGGSYFNGTMDELVIWNVSLSPEVIARHSGYGIDKSIYGNNATFMNGSHINFTGKFAEAMTFDGTDDGIDIPDSPSLSITGPMSVAAWFILVGFGGNDNPILISKGDNNPSEAETAYSLRGFGSSDILWQIHDDDFNAQIRRSVASGFLELDRWYHIVGTYDGGTSADGVKVYLNGVETGTTSSSGSFVSLRDTTAVLEIGHTNHQTGAKGPSFNGTIDELAIWNKSLSVDQIAELAGIKVLDYSGSGNNGSRINTTNFTISGKFGNAIEFDGVNDYVVIYNATQFKFNSSFSVATWVWADSQTTWGRIVNIDGGDWFLGWHNTDQWYEFRVDNVASSTVFTPTIEFNRWYHVVGVYDNGTGSKIARIYWDGALVDSDTGSGPVGEVYTSISNFSIGARIDNTASPTEFFDGTIDEVSIWNRSLTQKEIRNLYKRGVLRLNLSYRTSNDSSTFSVWKSVDNSTSSTIGEQARYLEYKAVFNTTDNAYTPVLHNVTVVVDSTCPCPSSGDWVIQDGCIVDTTCKMDGSDVYVTSGNNLTINAGGLSNFNNVFIYGNLFCRASACFG